MVPKTGFVNKLRKARMAKIGTSFTSQDIEKHLRDRRNMMLYHFSRGGKIATKKRASEEDDQTAPPVTRSSLADDDNYWVIDLDVAEGKMMDLKRLDRYCLEQLIPLPVRTSLLLLVNVDDDDKLLKGKAAKVHTQQQLTTRIINGREFY